MPFFPLLIKLALNNALGWLVPKVLTSAWGKIRNRNKANQDDRNE